MSEPPKRLFVRMNSSEVAIRKTTKMKNESRAQSFRGNNADQEARKINSSNVLEDLVQCGICLERLLEPRMLPCQHTFCLSCLKSHALAKKLVQRSNTPNLVNTDNPSHIQCPQCFKMHTLKKDVESLPTNVYIESLLKVLNQNSKFSLQASYNKPENRCVKCQIICNEHKLICQHCLQILCKLCWNEHILELEQKIPGLLKQLEDSETRLKVKMERQQERCDHLKEAIKAAAEERIASIRSLETNALSGLERLKNERENTAEEIKNRIQNMKIAINEKYPAVDESQKIAAFVALHKDTSALVDDIIHWGESRAVFDQETFTLEEDTESLYNETEEEDNESVRIFQNPLENMETLSMYYKTRKFEPKLVWTKCPRPAGLALSPWNLDRLYIAASYSQVVLILDLQKMKLTGRLTSEEMACPQSVAFGKDVQEIYVSDRAKHCIHVFSNTGEYLRALCAKGLGHGKLRSPEGIAVTNDGNIVVCDTGNDRIVILEPKMGNQICEIGVKEHRTELNSPTSVAVTNENNIIVADSGNNRIKIFDQEGSKLLEFASLGRSKGQVRSPEVVALDPMGFILVGDSGNARIQVFRPDGTFLRVLALSAHENCKFGWIAGIVVTPELGIVVSDTKNRCLQIF